MTGQQLFEQYKTYPGTWDEMCFDKSIRPQYQQVFNDVSQIPDEILHQKDKLAGELFMNQGITFTVYSDDAGIEMLIKSSQNPRQNRDRRARNDEREPECRRHLSQQQHRPQTTGKNHKPSQTDDGK